MLRPRFKPAVPRRWLLALAGLVWTVVSLGLGRLALGWLAVVPLPWSVLLGLCGLFLGLLIHRFNFSRVARKNIERICRSSERPCLFSFQAWHSWLLVALMIALGVTLRHSPLPRPILAVLYAAIGTALFAGSLQYYRRLWLSRHDKADC
jgi:hypothetical protein